ncbi:MAG: energy-coupling factor ABC transporter ATP-binding protein [Lachnospiraceae bacterium]|nr:energy-coupling factor ABC transporter ATP-binding protein [Lachnospiraceae bacterium]
MLKFDHVSFSYPGMKQTVKDLSFEVHAGEVVAMIGSNGAGKSTVSRLANGLLRPDSGHVYVDGEDTGKVRTSAIAKKVGFLFQNPDRQICQNTVREEIAFGPQVQGVPQDEIERRTEEMLQTFELDGDWFPFTRSRGERQRIALASVLACNPELVILDEPTTGLDYRECIRIMDYITGLSFEKGLTVLMVSHDMELVQEYAQRVLVLTDGRLVDEGPTGRIMKDMSVLGQAHVLPAQIPMLALRFGDKFSDVYTVEEMAEAIHREKTAKVIAMENNKSDAVSTEGIQGRGRKAADTNAGTGKKSGNEPDEKGARP